MFVEVLVFASHYLVRYLYYFNESPHSLNDVGVTLSLL